MKIVLPLLFLFFAIACDPSAKPEPAKDSVISQIKLALSLPPVTDTVTEIVSGLVPDETIVHYKKIPCPDFLNKAFQLAGIVRPDSLEVNYYYEIKGKTAHCSYLRTASFGYFSPSDMEGNSSRLSKSVLNYLDKKKKFSHDWYAIVGYADLTDYTIRIRLVTIDSWDTWCQFPVGDTAFTFHERFRNYPSNYPLITDQTKPLPLNTVFQCEWPDEREQEIRKEKIPLPDFDRDLFRMAGLVPPDTVSVNYLRSYTDKGGTNTLYYPLVLFQDFSAGDKTMLNLPAAISLVKNENEKISCTAYYDLISERIEILIRDEKQFERYNYMQADEGLYQFIESGGGTKTYSVFLNRKQIYSGKD